MMINFSESTYCYNTTGWNNQTKTTTVKRKLTYSKTYYPTTDLAQSSNPNPRREGGRENKICDTMTRHDEEKGTSEKGKQPPVREVNNNAMSS